MDGATHVTSVDWLWLIPFMPLLGAAVLGLTGASLQRAYGKKAVSVVACGSMAVSSAVTLGYFFFALLPAPADQRYLYFAADVPADERVAATRADCAVICRSIFV